MKSHLIIPVLIALGSPGLRAHDHVDIGRAAGSSKLSISAPAAQLATYFPIGESPSAFLPNFPGGAFANEVTFSAFELSDLPANGAYVRVEILAVTGPEGGSFSFWENNATSATWSRPTGWTISGTDLAFLDVSEEGSGGYGHRHGRVFTVGRPGSYEVTIRAVDTTGVQTTSDPLVLHFTAISPPPMSIGLHGGSVKLTFTGRPGLSYDVQRSETLKVDDWTIVGDPLDGTGSALEFIDPMESRSKAFYRLIEYP